MNYICGSWFTFVEHLLHLWIVIHAFAILLISFWAHMKTERDLLEHRGHSNYTKRTHTIYCEGIISQWCEGQNNDPVSPGWNILMLLTTTDMKGLAVGTVKVYVVSACHKGFARMTLFSHPLVKRFLTGTYRLRPLRACQCPVGNCPHCWRLYVNYVELINSLPMCFVSLKTSLLLPLTKVKRLRNSRRGEGGTISAHSSGPCTSNRSSWLTRPRPFPAYVPKVISWMFRAQSCKLR